jgi:hypothetical protein
MSLQRTRSCSAMHEYSSSLRWGEMSPPHGRVERDFFLLSLTSSILPPSLSLSLLLSLSISSSYFCYISCLLIPLCYYLISCYSFISFFTSSPPSLPPSLSLFLLCLLYLLYSYAYVVCFLLSLSYVSLYSIPFYSILCYLVRILIPLFLPYLHSSSASSHPFPGPYLACQS